MVGVEPTASGSPRRRATRLRYTLSVCDISRQPVSRKSWRDEQALPLQGPSQGSTAFQAAAVTHSACRPVVSCHFRRLSASVVLGAPGRQTAGPLPRLAAERGDPAPTPPLTGGKGAS